MKKRLIAVCIILLALLSLVMAQENKIEISTTKESFSAGESLTFKVSLYDAQNNPIDANVVVIIEDAEKRTRIERTIQSNKLIDINLGEKAKHGYWTITARYEDAEVTEFFTIEMNEEVRFEIQGDKLIVKNIGNARYTKTIQIIIGETLGTKKIDLEVGEETSFRLIAPDGTYNIKVTDGKTTITRSSVALTGNVIGILDEKLTTGGSPVTGGLRPKEGDESFYSTIRNQKFVYVFLLVVVGTAVLLAIERRYKKRV